ncbi:polygalacturonase [Rhizomicrobium palustre]|uniref:Polygalacturonase n=1 Tax=Rhizomicrobium palustre TaxID=189966 RepID=A0A846MTR4_9PROT|nr:polygalacturonase [Rhizomicrobium palustre]
MNLHLAEGTTLAFSTAPEDYLPLVLTRFEGVECMNYSPLIYAFEEKNIAVTGKGVLDGQAGDTAWWNWKGKGLGPNQSAARDKLFAMGDADTPVEERRFGAGLYLRPSFFEPYRCQQVMIEGVTIRNAPFWEVHPVLCRDVIVCGLTIDSTGPNTDGCDPESCQDMLIEDCTFNTGDDCIAIKSGRNGDGRRLHTPTENVVIRNCHMKNGHGGVSIGSEITGGVRNVFVENCRMDSPHLDNAIRIKNNAVRGGVLENIHFRNIVIGEIAHAVLAVHFDYEEAGNGPYRPVLRNLSLENVVSGKSETALDIRGLPNGVIEDVTLSHCELNGVAKENTLGLVRNLVLHDVKINGKAVRA